jgi:hypothetical protein
MTSLGDEPATRDLELDDSDDTSARQAYAFLLTLFGVFKNGMFGMVTALVVK